MTETKIYNYAETLDILNQLVAEKPVNYRDENSVDGACLYYTTTDPVRPPCLVGAFWEKLGVDERTRKELSRYGTIDGVLSCSALPIQVTEKAYTLLDRAQSAQDRGRSWARAVLAGMDSAAAGPYSDTTEQTP